MISRWMALYYDMFKCLIEPPNGSETMRVETTPITAELDKEYMFADNLLQDSILKLSVPRRMRGLGISKRSGDGAVQVLFTLLVWPLLSVKSICCFAGRHLDTYLKGGIATLYGFLRREDVDWRGLSTSVSKAAYEQLQLAGEAAESAFVFDDSIRTRRGKNVEGCSSHFDHTTRRHVMGQQVLEMGHASPKGYLPLDRQIYVSSKKRIVRQAPFKDSRSSVARDYRTAVECNKNEMLRSMLKRAIRAGFRASHVLADSWFSSKENIAAGIDAGLTVIMMMKRGNLKYRFQGREYTAAMLYQLVRRRMKPLGRRSRYMVASLLVDLNVQADPSKPPRWVRVRLVFSKLRTCTNDAWVVLLCSDPSRQPASILRTYALRWGIEVYFKEAKQHLGLLREQTGCYVVHYASVHLTAMRFTLLFCALQDSGGGPTWGQMRERISGDLLRLSFAQMTWELLKAVLYGVLDQFRPRVGEQLAKEIATAMNQAVDEFLQAALQIDDHSVAAAVQAEALELAA